VFERAAAFERSVIDSLSKSFGVVEIRRTSSDSQSVTCVEATWNAMRSGVEIIAQGVLWNPQRGSC
jgi:hypothetical protein